MTSVDLIRAILALDVYNRGIAPRINDLGVNGKLGDYTLLAATPEEQSGWAEASFYAGAYRLGDETVISFRGTDNWNFFTGDWGPGFPGGAGFISRQGDLALDFYRAVSDNPATNTITTTGHSLGGGLAGLTASLHGLDASIFNSMAFEAASDGYLAAASNDEAFSNRIYSAASPTQGIDRSKIRAFETNNDFLGLNRGFQATEITTLDSGFDFLGPNLFGRQTFFHSITGHVLLQWNEGRTNQNWRNADDLIWTSFIDDDVAAALPEAARRDAAPRDRSDALAVMQSAIAYSALGNSGDDASRPFGNTAINAMFDDANELGEALAISEAGTGILDALTALEVGLDPTLRLKEVLSNILVQYAGALALHDVEQPELGFLSIGEELVDAREGVLELAEDKKTLALDLASTLWGDVLRTASSSSRHLEGEGQLEAIGRDDALFAFYAQQSGFGAGFFNFLAFQLGLGNQLDPAEVEAQANALWEDTNGNTLTRFHYQLTEGGGPIDLSERRYGPGPLGGDDTEVDVFVGGASEDNVTGTEGNDLLILGNGDDVAYSLSGRDVIIGGAGDDTIVNNVIAENASDDGDAGEDIFIGQRLVTGGFQNFIQWLTAPKSLDFTVIEEFGDQFDYWAEDIVRYSVADPNGVPDLGEAVSLAPKGVELVNLEKTTFGEYDALRATVKDLNSGKISSDILVNIDVIQLSERAETVEVTDAFSELPIVLDLGDVQTGTVTSADYDTISFAQRSKGVFTANGSIRDQGNNPDNDVILGSFQVIAELLATATGAIFDTVFTPAAALHFRGAENVTLSDHDDLYFGGNVNALLGFDSDFFGTPNHPGYGKISGGEGEDVIVHYGSRFIFEDDYIDPEQQALADARDEAIANGETYEGEEPDPDAARAGADLQLVVDGGADDDRIFVLGGEGAIAVGGEGSDLIYNGSYKGQLYGDGQDGRGASYSGNTNDDTFWWSAGSFIMDAGKNDRLQLFGLPLVGGTNSNLFYGIALEKGTARDFLLPWVTYGLTDSGQLLVDASFKANLDPDQSEEEILQIAQVVENWESGDLGIEFVIFGGEDNISLFSALFKFIGDFAGHIGRFAKNLLWLPSDDPLVLDLNGDGLVSRGIGAVYWDNDGDLFGERSGWLSGEDGFLVHDADGDGRISAPELFGGPGLSGYDELSEWDTHGPAGAGADGIIDANDVAFGDLQIWRDANENGITDSGELHQLAANDNRVEPKLLRAG